MSAVQTTAEFVEALYAAVDDRPLTLFHRVVYQSPGIFPIPQPVLVGVVQETEPLAGRLVREDVSWHRAHALELLPDGMVRVAFPRGTGFVHRRHVRWGP